MFYEWEFGVSHSAKRHLLLYDLFVNKPVRVFWAACLGNTSLVYSGKDRSTKLLTLVKADWLVDF